MDSKTSGLVTLWQEIFSCYSISSFWLPLTWQLTGKKASSGFANVFLQNAFNICTLCGQQEYCSSSSPTRPKKVEMFELKRLNNHFLALCAWLVQCNHKDELNSPMVVTLQSLIVNGGKRVPIDTKWRSYVELLIFHNEKNPNSESIVAQKCGPSIPSTDSGKREMAKSRIWLHKELLLSDWRGPPFPYDKVGTMCHSWQRTRPKSYQTRKRFPLDMHEVLFKIKQVAIADLDRVTNGLPHQLGGGSHHNVLYIMKLGTATAWHSSSRNTLFRICLPGTTRKAIESKLSNYVHGPIWLLAHSLSNLREFNPKYLFSTTETTWLWASPKINT